jgi:uncharacterized protein CbrC (UPF0167 family)
MKQETIVQANNLIEKINTIKEFRKKVTISESTDRPENLDRIKTTIRKYNDNDKEFVLSLEKDGNANISHISDKGKAVLAHAADIYFKSLQSVFDSEISKLQKEFDNLKD